jgi:hypothetical protein
MIKDVLVASIIGGFSGKSIGKRFPKNRSVDLLNTSYFSCEDLVVL